tara:strand:- start:1211 stop:2245 length:1035 start_codon:yes stop_codon:yes gene_type:complete
MYSYPRIFIGNTEIFTFSSIDYNNSGNNAMSTLSVNITDAEYANQALLGKEVVFYLNYGAPDTVPFFRGRVKQATPSDKGVKIKANDVRTFLGSKDSMPLFITDRNNFDGYTLGQFLYEHIFTNINTKETLIGLDMLNDTDPPITLSKYRADGVTALDVVKALMPKDKSDMEDVRAYRLIVRDDGIKSNIAFVREQNIDSSGVDFSYSDGIKKLTYKKRPSANIISAQLETGSIRYKHNSLSTSATGMKLSGKFEYPDEATQAAYIQATKEEKSLEISLVANKGHYLELGNIINVYTPNFPEVTGKHRIVSKSVKSGSAAPVCTLKLSKEIGNVSTILSNVIVN